MARQQRLRCLLRSPKSDGTQRTPALFKIPLQLFCRYDENRPASSKAFLAFDDKVRRDSRNSELVLGEVIWWSSMVEGLEKMISSRGGLPHLLLYRWLPETRGGRTRKAEGQKLVHILNLAAGGCNDIPRSTYLHSGSMPRLQSAGHASAQVVDPPVVLE